MNSLNYLNGVSDTVVSFTDNRPSNVLFDRPKAKDIAFTDTSLSFNVIAGINIIELIGTPNVRYQIEVGSSYATVTLGSLPTGVTLVQSGNTYTFYGIDSVSDWNAVKSPLITLTAGFAGNVYYNPTILYDTDIQSNLQQQWTVGVFVPEAVMPTTSLCTITANKITGIQQALTGAFTINQAILTRSGFTDTTQFDWLAGVTNQITGAPQLIYENTSNESWSVTVTPDQIDRVDTIQSTISGNTSFDTTTKVLTITGTFTDVNTHLNNLTITNLSVKQDFVLTYVATSDATELTNRAYQASQTANCSNIDYLSEPRGIAYHTPGVPTVFGTVAPNILDPDYTNAGNYVYKATAVTPSQLTSMSTTGITRWGTDQELSKDIYFRDEDRGDGPSVAFNSTGDIMAVGYRYNTNSLGQVQGALDIYYLQNNTWTWVQTFTGGSTSQFGQNVRFATDDTLIIAAYADFNSAGRVYIYKRNAGLNTFTLDQTLVGESSWQQSNGQYTGYFGFKMDSSADGDLLLIINHWQQSGSGSGSDGVTRSYEMTAEVWTRTGSGSYSRVQVINVDNTFNGTSVLFDSWHDATVSGNADRFALTSWYNGIAQYGYTQIYKHNGTSWAIEHTVQTDTPGQGYVLLSPDSNTLWQMVSRSNQSPGVPGKILQYNYNGSSWSSPSTINAQISSNDDYFGADMRISDDGLKVFIRVQADEIVEEHSFNQSTHTLTYVRSLAVEGPSSSQSVLQSIMFVINTDGSKYALGALGADLKINSYGPKPGVFNAVTGEITINGTKAQVNQDIETMSITTPSDSLYNVRLNYQVTTPEANTESKTQLVFKQI